MLLFHSNLSVYFDIPTNYEAACICKEIDPCLLKRINGKILQCQFCQKYELLPVTTVNVLRVVPE